MTGREPRCYRGSIGIVDDRIAFVSEDPVLGERFRQEQGKDVREIDGRGRLVMPGFINIHNHAAMTLMRSYADDIPLMRWLNDYIWPFEAKLTRDDVRLGTELAVAEMLLGGTTTFVDMYWRQEAVGEVVERTGIRAVLSATFTDAQFADFEKDLALLLERYADGRHPRIQLMLSPHAVYSCSKEHLLQAKELRERYGFGVNIHVSETKDEQRMIRERYGMTPVQYLDSLGLLDARTLAVHCVYVDEQDIEILKRRGVSVAYNPQSNMKISSGIAPVVKMMSAGVNVGIGTDGPCSNNDLDMWDEIRSGSFLQKVASEDPCVVPAYELLRMATVCGAKAIGREADLGQIKAGMVADLQIIDLRKPHFYPQHDVVANLVYCAKSSDVDTVIVNGEILVEGGRLRRFDLPTLLADVQQRVEEIVRR